METRLDDPDLNLKVSVVWEIKSFHSQFLANFTVDLDEV